MKRIGTTANMVGLVAVALSACTSGSGSGGSGDSAAEKEAKAAIEDVSSIATLEILRDNGDGLGARLDALHAGRVPAAQKLVEGGDTAAKLVREELESSPDDFFTDEAFVVYSFVLGRLGDTEALAPLSDVIDRHMDSEGVLGAPAAADAIFTILSDPRRRTDTFDYDLEAQDAARAAATSAQGMGSSTDALETGPITKCKRKYVLADDMGNPLTYVDEKGQTVPASFECQEFSGDLTGPYRNTPAGQEIEQKEVNKVTGGGGTFVPEYDDGRPSQRYNCAGFAFREFTKGNAFNCYAPTMLMVLTRAGVLQKSTAAPKVNDKVFFRPKAHWTEWKAWTTNEDAPAHVAVVHGFVDGKPVVRAPDNFSGVFDAGLDAAYFKEWTAETYEWKDGKTPNVISAVDPNVDPRYCKDECGGACTTDQVCLDGMCVAKTAQTSCELRVPQCCPGQDNSCTAPDAACFCDAYCVEAGDCCPDACNTCGYCGG